MSEPPGYFDDDDIEGWDGDLVRVSRHVPFFDFEAHTVRSVEEFATALLVAAHGLTDAHVDGHNYYDSIRVVVVGNRPPAAEESEQRRRTEYHHWLAAKGVYERDRERWSTGAEQVLPAKAE